MSVRAYILIEALTARSREVAAELRNMEGVKAVDIVTGPYDLIAMADQPDLESLRVFVAERASRTPGVKRTVTCVASRPM
ncbi:MAG: Lrp/AsnC ligand binding domain-containing protein [Dehalococcoidales bacterium]|nr:Lrp/AsnC ligand binding domain-containing protein [Dehalococcoidales bacterium]